MLLLASSSRLASVPPAATAGAVHPGSFRSDTVAMRQFDLRRQPKLGLFRRQFPHRRGAADQPAGQPKFCPVRLDAEALFDYPFCVMSGNENFSLTQKEREQLRKYLTQGGFLLVSPGCSDEKWDKSFRQEIKVCFPEYRAPENPHDPSDFFHRQSNPPADGQTRQGRSSSKDSRSTAGWCWFIPRRG